MDGGTTTKPETVELVRLKVRELLEKNDAFRALSPDKRMEIAKHTVEIANYLCEPEGIRLPQTQQASSADPYAVGLAGEPRVSRRSRGGAGEGVFTAQAAREGAAVAGALLQAVNFPTFVSSLIDGVFHAIVKASIEQMEAYGKLVADVAKTLNQFRDENVSVNQGRDYLVDTYPESFQLQLDTGDFGETGPRVVLRDNADEKATLAAVNSMPIEGGPLTSLSDESIEQKLVPAARTQLATSRQQLLATMVLMGINRIVVTDGRISAKVLYDFQARDNFKYQHSATKFDYDPTKMKHTHEGEYEKDVQGAEGSYERSKEGSYQGDYKGASYYAKGQYKYTAEPVLTLASATQASTDAALQTKASLAGQVEVNFKSETFPLEKMADSFQIGRIQDAAKPATATRAPAGTTSAPATSTPAPAAK
jgi:hypothetical protein